MSKLWMGRIVLLVGAGMIIAGVLVSLRNLWSPGLIIVGAAAGYVGYWITKNVK